MSRPTSFAERYQAEKEQRARAERRNLIIVSSAYLLVFLFIGWLVPPITILIGGALGIWLVAGRGSSWLRMIVAALFLFPAIYFNAMWAGIAAMVFGWTVMFSFVAQRIAAWQWGFPLRRTPFTLWNLAGLILACSLVFAFIRLYSEAYEASSSTEYIAHVLGAFHGAVCCVVAGFPLLVPRSLRTAKLCWSLAGILLVAIPFVIGVLATANSPALLLLGLLFFAVVHGVGAGVLWMVLAPLDFCGLFQTYEPQTEATSP